MKKWCLIFLGAATLLCAPLSAQTSPSSTNAPVETAPAPEAQKILSFEELILSQNFWDMTLQDISKSLNASEFRWVSNDKNEARSTSSKLKFRGSRIYEAILRLKDGKPSEVMLSLFNRGDAGNLNDDDFEKEFASYTKTINEITSTTGQDISKGEGTANRRMKTIVWVAEPTSFRLEYAISKVDGSKRAEFVTLVLRKGDKTDTAEQLAGTRKVALDTQSLKDRVKSNDKGDFWIEVPMVDQGQKGYCSAATTERVMRYYGLDINQHQLAQIADTETGGGTNPDALYKGIRSLGKNIGIRPELMEDSDSSDFMKIIHTYNKMAKKMKKKEVFLHPGQNSIVSLYSQMDREAFIASRMKSDIQLRKFMSDVSGKTKAGIPVVWSIIYGMVDEIPQGARTIGGHTRLIVGFNEKTSEILYTDSWGAGHELKRMKLGNAYAITTHMFSAELSGVN